MKGYSIRETIEGRCEVGCYDSSGKWQLARRFNSTEEAEIYASDLNKHFQSIMEDYNEKTKGHDNLS